MDIYFLTATIVMLSIIAFTYQTLLNAMNIVYSQAIIYLCGVVVSLGLMFILLKVFNLGPYYFLLAINSGICIPAIVLPLIFRKIYIKYQFNILNRNYSVIDFR